MSERDKPRFGDYESAIDHAEAVREWRRAEDAARWDRLENGLDGSRWRTQDAAGDRMQRAYNAADAEARRQPPPSWETQRAAVHAQAAARFAPDPKMEILTQWQANGDRRYDQLDAVTKVSLGYYLHDKQAADEAKATGKEARRGA